jgi:hypothetical protein
MKVAQAGRSVFKCPLLVAFEMPIAALSVPIRVLKVF